MTRCAALPDAHHIYIYIFAVRRATGRRLKEGKVATSLAAMSDSSFDTVARLEATLNDVDRALERLRNGSYRRCQVCDAPIDEAALVATPLLANCPAHPELG